MRKRLLFLLMGTFLCALSSFTATAQSTGFINRPATASAGRAILDPNGDGYTSAATTGFAGNDVGNSELPYRSVPSFSTEPFGDLRRGPDHLYSDFVPDASSVGYYSYFNGSQLLFRFRMGSVMPGSKGYSVLLDTDGKFGATGANADPNYQPATSGTNGNPGFEIEVVLETNFRIAIYNVDGSSMPVLVKEYTAWQDMSQVSVAGTFDNGDPDFFIDFYIPFSDLQAAPFALSTATSLRMSATTVMAPQAAIGGPKSDIYGLSDDGYKTTNDQYEAYINAQPSFTAAGLNTGGIGAMCTAAPVVSSPLGTGTVSITGTWTRSALDGAAATATITVYKNGTSAGTVTNVASGSTWTLGGITLVNGDVITAKAKATTESECLVSNEVRAQGCNTSNIPSTTGFTITCATNNGLEGTFVSGNEVKVYLINPTTLATSTLAGPAAQTTIFGYSGSNWYYNGDKYNGNNITSACSGGNQDLVNGVYYVTTNNATGTCESAPVFACIGLAGTTATPVITQTALYSTSTQVSGTAATGAQVYLRINGQLQATTTAAGGTYSFTGLPLATGDLVEVRALSTNSCMSAAASLRVTCYTTPPLIGVDNNGQLTAGQAITGSSSEPAGTTIRVYTAANALVATTTVQSGGTWTTGAVTAAAGTSYYATAQNGSCAVSVATATAAAVTATTGRCGSITGPVSATATSVAGTLTGTAAGTTVNLYLDGIAISSATTSTSSWTITIPAATPLYANGVLTIGVQETGRGEQYCAAPLTISCSSGPATPVISPSTSTLTPGQTQTYTVSNAETGAFYGIADATTGRSLGTGVWATGSTVTLTTNTFSTGTYSVAIKGTSLSGVSVCSSPPAAASLLVSSTLPLTLLEFTGRWKDGRVLLDWRTAEERDVAHFTVERSTGSNRYEVLGRVGAAAGGEGTYAFTDPRPAAVNHYRLRMTDRDGSFSYSKTVVVHSAAAASFSVYPNPFAGAPTIQVTLEEGQTLRLELADRGGQVVLQAQAWAGQGTTSLQLPVAASLKPGAYFLTVQGKSFTHRRKLVKVAH